MQPPGPRASAVHTASRLTRRLELPLLALWLGLGWALSEVTTRVADWFVMTDELFYERLGISVAHLHSPLPRVHGVLIPNINQLYPLLLATVYSHGYVPQSLHAAHRLNAFVMTSAAIPAFLLARRVTGKRSLGYLVAVLTIVVPWLVYSLFLLTEVVGYPAFLWAVLGIQAMLVAPSSRRDGLAVAGLALAILARTQFAVLVVIVPFVTVAYELAEAPAAGRVGRLRRATRIALRKHRVLAWFYAVLALGVIALLATGHLSSLLGTYGVTLEGDLLPGGTATAVLELLAILSLSLGILPFVLGIAWLLARAVQPAAGERYAFALIGSAVIAAVTVEVAIFERRFGAGVVQDRYLFYIVPIVFVAFAASLGDKAWPRKSLLIPVGLTVLGLAVAQLPVSGTLNVDSAVSGVNRHLVSSLHSLDAARATLAVTAFVATILFVQGSVLLSHRLLAALLAALALSVLPVESVYAFKGILDNPGSSGRPLTVPQGDVFDWVDRTVGTGASVTMIPYPSIDGDYGASIAYWWDVEFWNESVAGAAYYPGQFEGTPSTFRKLDLRFDPTTGASNISPTRFVVVNQAESRFRIDGNNAAVDRGALLIDTGGTWRADWITFGLYDDGWTRPDVTARVRIFASPGQKAARLRTLVFEIRSPVERRPVEIRSDAADWKGRISASQGTTVAEVTVCQPARGFTDVRIAARGETSIHGDMMNLDTFTSEHRTAGVFLAGIDLQHFGKTCRP